MNDTKLNKDLNNSFKFNINIEQSMGFLNYLELFLANTATKRVQGYARLAWHTIRCAPIDRFIGL